MEKSTDRKPAVGLGFIGRGLGELLELKASCRNRLEYLEQNRGRLSEYVYNKLTQEYRACLDAVDGEVELGLSEYEIKLAEIRLFANQLKLLEKSYSERLEELSLRYSLGEFGREHYQQLCAQHESKLKKFSGSLEKYQGQKQKLEAFLTKADWRGAAAQPVAEESVADMKVSELAESVAVDESLVEEERQAPQPEPVAEQPQAPPPGNGPPCSSLLELESALDEVSPGPEPELPVIEPEPDVAEQPAELDSTPEPEMAIEEPSDLPEQPPVGAVMEKQPAPEADAALDELPALTETPPLVEAVTVISSAPAPEAVAEEVEAASEPEQPESAPESLEELMPEQEAVAEEIGTDVEPREIEELPEVPAAAQQPAEKPFQLEVDLPEQQSQAGQQANGGSTGTDLEALMGGGLDISQPESAAESAVAGQNQADAKEESGFDLESIFGSSAMAPEPQEQPVTELEFEAPVSAPETASEPEPGAPVEPVQQQQSVAAGSVEDELLNDLATELPPPSAGQEPAVEPEHQQAEKDGGLDLDDLIDEAGSAASPVLKPQSVEPPAEAPDQDISEPEPQPEEHLDELAQAPEVREPVETPQQPQQEEEPALAEPEITEPEPESEPESQERAEPTGGAGSLVSMALQRAAQEHQESVGAVEVAVDLDDGVELIDGGEAADGEAEVRLTMNQTIDAIKKKTIKCPNCGTMNYAIRWYCENCESTLTSL